VRIAIRTALPLALLALVLSACGPGGNPANAAEVNGDAIPLTALEQRFESVEANPQFAEQFAADDDGTLQAQVQASILSELIRAAVWQQGAAELGLDVSDADVEERREQLVDEVGGQEAFDDLVEQSGLTEDILQAEIRMLLVQERVREELGGDVEVTDADVEGFYEDERAQRYEQVEARHILVETEEEADDARSRIEDGEDFADVAEDLSIDTQSAERGGDLGQPFGRGQMVPEFEEAAFDADVGELVGPVESQFGFHIIEVTDRVEHDLDDVAEEIREELRSGQEDAAVQAWFAEQLEAADVVVNPRFGEWDAASGEVVPAGAPESELDVQPAEPEPEVDPELDADD
jgi:parvulin-like peptidyl-prolyl isomerase